VKDEKTVQIEDPPDPALPELQQRDLPFPTVPVEVPGKVRVQPLPARNSSANAFPMDTTLRRVLGADPKRSRVQLVSTVAWLYGRTASGERVPWPANVVCVVTHSDEIYAAVPTSTGTLAVIAEYYAD
jgi:hypothetical protein